MPQLTSRGLAVALFAVAALVSGLATSTDPLVVLGAAAGAVVVGAAISVCLGHDSPTIAARAELPPGPLLQRAVATVGLSFATTQTRASGPLLVDDPARAWVRARAARKTTGDQGQAAPRGAPRPIVRIGRVRRARPATSGASTMAIGVPTEYRGLVVLGPCRIWRADGLWLCVRRVGATPSVPMLVCPSPIDVPRRDLPHGVGAPELAWSAPSPSSAADVATRRTKRTGEGDQWSGLRDYVPGDRLAAVHWPLSLRRGRLLVREMSSSCDDPLVAVVDLSRDAVPTDVDLAASWAAGIGVAALRRGRSVAVGMWRGGSTCRVVASETLTELLSVLALVETMEERCPAPCTLGAEEVDGGIVISAHNGEVCCRTSLVAVANGATEGAQ